MKQRARRRKAYNNTVQYDGFTFLRAFAVKRCRTYEQYCPICEYWRFLETRGRFPTLEETCE